ncbi:Semaphorin-3F [Bagarius yarrelli]|uniref:Semaphorin-3F n=1 Tax=Bagarius yarrelli TaxID=175774 RepID=A0A556U3P2_BAGYA|nr:Semaphorin-3F [Bagarius yarrelli]
MATRAAIERPAALAVSLLAQSTKSVALPRFKELLIQFTGLECFSMFLDTMIVQSSRDLFLGTLLVCVFSAVSVQSNPFASLPPLSAPRIYLSFKGNIPDAVQMVHFNSAAAHLREEKCELAWSATCGPELKLKSTGTAHHFSFLLNSTDYRILRMDEDHDRMYVGSKDYILSLDLNDINKEPLIGECGNFIRLIEPWNRTHLYVCGTGAYNPICTYVDRGQKSQALMQNQNLRAGGRTSRAAEPSASPEPYAPKEYIFRLEPGKVDSGKGKCPFDPKLNSVSALINPTFVHAQLIPDSAEKNDDKLYFFFREKASEMGQTPMTQSRIGRICLNDDGGHCCLVNKWSTFLKSRLICSVTGADGIETHFDELRDVFIQKTQDTKNPVIYGVFSVSGSVFKGSAICVYSMADVRMVFNGPFAHKEGPNYQWIAYQGKIPYPRPGTIRSDGRMLHTDQGLLLRSLQLSDAGTYQCTATEKNFKHTLVKLQLLVLSVRTVNNIQMETGASLPAMPAIPLQTSAWTPSAEQYKDLLTILSQPEMGLINQYCQDYWQIAEQDKKDPYEAKEQRKPRNRRHHETQRSSAET